MDNKFIPITELVQPNKNLKVYQIQPHKNSSTIVHVGNMEKVYDIDIHTFEIDNLKCYITNKIYNLDLLCESLLLESPQIQIIDILYCVNDNNYPSAHLSINFHPTFSNIDKNKLETIYITEKDKVVHIDGYYTISFHLNNGKVIILDDKYEFTDKDTMLVDLYEYANDEDVINFTNKNIK
jgi:hypothetical protein